MKRSSSEGFTLVELLAVIAIVGLMLALSLPAFRDITRGSKRSAAAMELRAILSLARQWAITHRDRVYIVFPATNVNLFATSKKEAALAYRSFNVFSVSQNEFLREWITLPDGMVFDAGATTSKTNFINIFSGSVPDYVRPVPFPMTVSNNMVVIEFKPDGMISQPSQSQRSPMVVFREGWVDADTNTGKATVEFRGTNVLSAVVINAFSSTIKVFDL